MIAPTMPPALARQRRLLVCGFDTVTLSDGRILVSHGERSWSVNRTRLSGTLWVGPEALCVITSLDDCSDGLGPLFHVAAAYHDRLPDWDTMHALRDAFFPDDVDVMMMLPRQENYVNEMPYCLHLIQTPAVWPRKV